MKRRWRQGPLKILNKRLTGRACYSRQTVEPFLGFGRSAKNADRSDLGREVVEHPEQLKEAVRRRNDRDRSSFLHPSDLRAFFHKRLDVVGINVRLGSRGIEKLGVTGRGLSKFRQHVLPEIDVSNRPRCARIYPFFLVVYKI